jgi:MoxR-like ATPase
MGSSPRGSITLMQVSKAIALINGRSYVIPDDIKTLIFSALRHRITLNYAAIADNIQPEAIINAIIGSIRTP